MSIVAKKIEEIVKLRLAPLLKQHGFTKSGRDFHRQRERDWQVVNVQASQGNLGEDGKFTVNLGVYVSAVAALAGTPALEGKPKEHSCTVRERIGMLMREQNDHWWNVSPSISSEQTAKDVASAVEQFGIPWLEAHLRLETIAETLKPQPSVMSAAAALAAGDTNEAKRRIQFMAADRPMAATTAMAWARKHGLQD